MNSVCSIKMRRFNIPCMEHLNHMLRIRCRTRNFFKLKASAKKNLGVRNLFIVVIVYWIVVF